MRLVDPTEQAGFATRELEESGHLETFPEASLALLDRLAPDEPPQWWGQLTEMLARIRKADPELGDDPRFRRLDQIATDRGL